MKSLKLWANTAEVFDVTKEIERSWFIFSKDTVLGPLGRDQVLIGLKRGVYAPSDMIWTRGIDWKPISQWAQNQTSQNHVWYVFDKGLNSGPFDIDHLINGFKTRLFSTASKLWTQGFTSWMSIFEVPMVVETLQLAPRRNLRAPFVGQVYIEGIEKTSEELATCTISSGGMGVRGLNTKMVGRELTMSVESPLLTGAFFCRAKVVYQNDQEAGLAFTHVSPENLAVVTDYLINYQSA